MLARYAAADLATPRERVRAIGLVISATTLGAVLGPNLLAPAAALHLPQCGLFLVAILALPSAPR